MLKTTKLSSQLAQKSTALIAYTSRNLSCTAIQCIDQRWREARGLPENPNAFGPLTNLPDYTYLDGRPTPLGSNQKKRLLKQQEIAGKIVTLNQELNFAKERHASLKSQKQAERKQILDNKLKPKGHLLLKKD